MRTTRRRCSAIARLVGGGLLVVISLAASALPVYAQQIPDVSNLQPFSVETNFMSLPGYLRWLTFQTTGQWITYAEAARFVQQQLAAAP